MVGQAVSVARGAEVLEEPLECAAPARRDADHLAVVALHAIGVRAGLGDEAEVARGEQLLAHLFGDLITIYARGEQTENTFNFFTVEGPKGDVIPAHLHPDTHEVFCVTQGAVRLFVEDTDGNQQDRSPSPFSMKYGLPGSEGIRDALRYRVVYSTVMGSPRSDTDRNVR
ncbi:hypothetical protein [Streptomyces sp. NPDC001415]